MIIVDVEFTSLLGAGPEAFVVEPTPLVFYSDETMNITVSFGAPGLRAGRQTGCVGGLVQHACTQQPSC